ncbi:MAG: hypothetical protein ABIQ31_05725 [Ferruginibacter sp.]
MSKAILREKLHQIIDELEDKAALEKLYGDALEYKYSWLEEDPLTEEEWAEIGEGLAQIRNDEPCTHEAAVAKFTEWQLRK